MRENALRAAALIQIIVNERGVQCCGFGGAGLLARGKMIATV